jgi:AraC family transcriptional regulator
MSAPAPGGFLHHGQFMGDSAGDRAAGGFVVAKRVPTVPEHEVQRHTHSDAHYVRLLEGVYLTSAEGPEPTLDRPALIFNPAGTTHRDSFRGDGGLFLSVSVSAAADVEFEAAAALPSHAVQLRGASMERALALSREYDRAEHDASLVLESLCVELLDATAADFAAAHGRPPRWLRSARELIREECASDLGLARIAAEVGMHPVSVTRAFRRHFRCTPGDYLRRCRLSRAAAMLADTDAPLSLIAQACGFFDQAHLTRCFVAGYGLPPARYRAQRSH